MAAIKRCQTNDGSPHRGPSIQIGRASCRERVFTEVLFSKITDAAREDWQARFSGVRA